MSLSHLVAWVVYILILVPAVVAALQALEIEVITGPATDMLNTMMATIPDIFAAAIILGIAFAISRLVSHLMSNLLGGLGFDALPGQARVGAGIYRPNHTFLLSRKNYGFSLLCYLPWWKRQAS